MDKVSYQRLPRICPNGDVPVPVEASNEPGRGSGSIEPGPGHSQVRCAVTAATAGESAGLAKRVVPRGPALTLWPQGPAPRRTMSYPAQNRHAVLCRVVPGLGTTMLYMVRVSSHHTSSLYPMSYLVLLSHIVPCPFTPMSYLVILPPYRTWILYPHVVPRPDYLHVVPGPGTPLPPGTWLNAAGSPLGPVPRPACWRQWRRRT